MYTFWQNISKFPKFIISVLLGFFLTTFYPVFKSLKNQKINYLSAILILLILLYSILKSMLGYADTV
uniref:Uncharacterized protein ycf33 n=1 Tax=Scinaia undulata TaxID=1884664 RepID=A0A1G4NXS2_9FLOR|nr:Hypothetical protein ycf33 [Scinaia undulata]SCW23468.1 Hypothetical protein ycf33 [Scinaia undulata]